MKSVKLFYLGILTGLLLLMFSCEEPPTTPDTDPRATFLGTWLCTETSASYHVSIILDSNNTSQILIKNFHLYGNNEKVYAIATKNNITLPNQNILNNIVYGSASLISNNYISWKYYINNQTDIDTVIASYTK